MYLSKGNTKLSKTILIFSLPTVKTCPNCATCKNTCYARKSEHQYPNVLKSREKNYQESQSPTFVIDMTYKISKIIVRAQKHKPKYFHIHESGDFYSKDYAQKWIQIAKNIPELHFYTNTKALDNIPWSELPPNLNIIPSILPDGEINYGPHNYVNHLSKKYGAKICPYKRAKNKPVICGETCKACMTAKYVVFNQH